MSGCDTKTKHEDNTGSPNEGIVESENHLKDSKDQQQQQPQQHENFVVKNGEENEDKLCELNVRCFVFTTNAVTQRNNSDQQDKQEKQQAEQEKNANEEWKNYGGPSYVRILQDRNAKTKRIVVRTHGTKRVILNTKVTEKPILLNDAEGSKLNPSSLLQEAEIEDDQCVVVIPSMKGAFVFVSKTDKDTFVSCF